MHHNDMTHKVIKREKEESGKERLERETGQNECLENKNKEEC